MPSAARTVAAETPPPPSLVGEPAPHAAESLISAPRLSSPRGIATLPLFECAHVKFAWGHEFRGFVLDEAGRVWLFDRGGWGWTPEFLDSESASRSDDSPWLGRGALAAHIAPALSTACIAVTSLREHSALIARAQLGELPPLKPEKIPLDGVDGEYCSAYRWNEAHTAYQYVDLRRNSSPEAASLSRWLNEIEQALMQSPFNAIASELARTAVEANEEILRRAELVRSLRTAPMPKELLSFPPAPSGWRKVPGF